MPGVNAVTRGSLAQLAVPLSTPVWPPCVCPVPPGPPPVLSDEHAATPPAHSASVRTIAHPPNLSSAIDVSFGVDSQRYPDLVAYGRPGARLRKRLSSVPHVRARVPPVRYPCNRGPCRPLPGASRPCHLC